MAEIQNPCESGKTGGGGVRERKRGTGEGEQTDGMVGGEDRQVPVGQRGLKVGGNRNGEGRRGRDERGGGNSRLSFFPQSHLPSLRSFSF